MISLYPLPIFLKGSILQNYSTGSQAGCWHWCSQDTKDFITTGLPHAALLEAPTSTSPYSWQPQTFCTSFLEWLSTFWDSFFLLSFLDSSDRNVRSFIVVPQVSKVLLIFFFFQSIFSYSDWVISVLSSASLTLSSMPFIDLTYQAYLLL